MRFEVQIERKTNEQGGKQGKYDQDPVERLYLVIGNISLEPSHGNRAKQEKSNCARTGGENASAPFQQTCDMFTSFYGQKRKGIKQKLPKQHDKRDDIKRDRPVQKIFIQDRVPIHDQLRIERNAKGFCDGQNRTNQEQTTAQV